MICNSYHQIIPPLLEAEPTRACSPKVAQAHGQGPCSRRAEKSLRLFKLTHYLGLSFDDLSTALGPD